MKRAALEAVAVKRENPWRCVCPGPSLLFTSGNTEESHALSFQFPGFIEVDYVVPANLTTYLAIFTSRPLKGKNNSLNMSKI